MKSEYKFRPKKRFGQHFLTNKKVVERILSCAELDEHDCVLEVGPGPGILTQAILESPTKHLTSVEIDTQFWTALEALESPRFTLMKEDALSVPLVSFEGTLKIVANLPYNVGNQLIVQWMASLEKITLMVLMLQKEVVDRLGATPKTKDYGRLSILVQSLCDVERCFIIGPGNFSPPPKVDSAVVKITPKAHKVFSLEALSELTRTFFQARRKIIRHALKKLDIDAEDPVLDKIGVCATMRPEEITVTQYVEMAIAFEDLLR